MIRHARQIDQLLRMIGRAPHAEAGPVALRLLDEADRLRPRPGPELGRDPIALVERVLRRRRAALCARIDYAVARALPEVPERDRPEILLRLGPRLTACTAELLRSERDADLGLALVRLRPDWALVPLIAGVIGDDPARTDRAAECLIELAQSSQPSPGPTPAQAERALAAVLEAADIHGSSRATTVVRAALTMLSPAARSGALGRRAATWLDGTPESLRLVLRSVVRTLPGPHGAARALELLDRPEFRRAACERIAGASEDPDDLRALHRSAHLALRPCRRSALRSRLERAALRGLALPDDAPPTRAEARGVARWIDALGLPRRERTGALEPLLAHADPAARLSAVLMGSPALLRDCALDAHPAIANAAALRLALPAGRHAGEPSLEPADRDLLARVPHESLRSIARRLPVRGDESPCSLVSFRSRLARDPTRVIDELAEGIARRDERAIRIATRLEVGDHLLQPLADLIRTGDERLAALAVRALGSCRAQSAAETLAEALRHPDARVRANAVEAAGARRRRLGQPPAPLVPDDPHHRPASSSIRELLLAGGRIDDPAARVHELLASEDADRRAAGLWLTERAAAELKPIAGARWADLAARVADAARHAPTERERRRATRCARRMLAAQARPL